MDRAPSTVGPLLPSDPQSQAILWWSLAAAGAAAAGATVWWLTRERIDEVYRGYVPIQYQYRPGTFTGWVANKLAKHAKRRRSRRPLRVYMDGCFDLMHYGHANALRQAKAVGDQLVVGLIPDCEILRCKGPPVLNERERLRLVESIKWVDEVITGVPYDLTPEFLEELFHKHKIDLVIHGDDPCLLPDGTDAYAHAKKLGRFRMIKRTEGVSTTDIVGRMLMCTRDNSRFTEERVMLAREFSRAGVDSDSDQDLDSANNGHKSRNTTVSKFMPTSRRIVQFSSGRAAGPDAKIVYIDGAFDLFHVGHVEILKKAREQGDFLLVGIHSDEDVTERRGPHLPIMNLHERALSVLACRYVDEVIIGAPTVITEDLLTTFNISLVVRGTVSETRGTGVHDGQERYEVPRSKSVYRELQSPDSTTSATVIKRIVENRTLFEARQAKKTASETQYYTSAKTYVSEV